MDPRFSVILSTPDSWSYRSRRSQPSPQLVGGVMGLGLAFPAALTWACLFAGAATSIFWSLASAAIAAGAAWPMTRRLQGRNRLALRIACGICVFGPAVVLAVLPLLARC